MKLKIVVFFIVSALALYVTYPKKKEEEVKYYPADALSTFKVTISGAVIYPGTYEFYEPISIEEIIKLAGGLYQDADLSRIQMGQMIQTKETLIIPSIVVETDIRISINTATLKELLRIPYINEKKASDIIEYRKTHGGFTKVEDLLDIKGIGPATLEKIKPYIRLY